MKFYLFPIALSSNILELLSSLEFIKFYLLIWLSFLQKVCQGTVNIPIVNNKH